MGRIYNGSYSDHYKPRAQRIKRDFQLAISDYSSTVAKIQLGIDQLVSQMEQDERARLEGAMAQTEQASLTASLPAVAPPRVQSLTCILRDGKYEIANQDVPIEEWILLTEHFVTGWFVEVNGELEYFGIDAEGNQAASRRTVEACKQSQAAQRDQAVTLVDQFQGGI